MHVQRVAPGDQEPSVIGQLIETTGSTGVVTLVAGVTGRRIRLWRAFIQFTNAADITFRSGSTDLTGSIPVPAGATVALDTSPIAWATTALGEALNINVSASTDMSGMIAYSVDDR
jgi:hypothetical protein